MHSRGAHGLTKVKGLTFDLGTESSTTYMSYLNLNLIM